MDKLIIHHNTGVGDHLLCNGLVNYMSNTKKVYLICNIKNFSSIKYLYSENKNVKILPILRNNRIEHLLLKLARKLFNSSSNNSEKLLSKIYSKIIGVDVLYVGFDDVTYPEWDKSLYKAADINFKIRYSFFKLPRKLPRKPRKIPEDFIFIQDVSSQGRYDLKIDSEKEKIYIGETKTKNFFENLFFVYNAKEIHCIDSSLVHLIESIEPKKEQKLYFHDVERYNQSTIPDAKFHMRHDWEIIKYKDSSSFY